MSRATDRKAEPEGRNSRAWESRYTEDRLVNIRRAIHMQHGDPFYIPKEKIPDGIHYYWVRIHIFKDGSGAEPEFNRFSEMYEKGWDFVPAARHPEFATMDLNKRSGKLEQCIVRRGHVLVERPKELGEEEMRIFAKEVQRTLQTVPGKDSLMNNPMGGMKTENFDLRHKTGDFME